ncbi:unnamed protein product [Paramecium primaurelia]|uniref:Uncharacterized protein n=1 Tax=Paramecium primaurelia TaxID=5886 RepID=A0A8S1Q0L3_PARPR|nr:unnamed protein product [Paramecium primaurelia]
MRKKQGDGKFDMKILIFGEIKMKIYNKCESLKIGQWIDLDKRVYFRNNKNVGRWDIWFRQYDEKEFKQIGGGSYDENGEEIKIGKWIELDNRFFNLKQVTYNVQIIMGKKLVHRILHIDHTAAIHFQQNTLKIVQNQLFANRLVAGDGDIKNGKWVDLDDELYNLKQIIEVGEQKNGKKEGKLEQLERELYKIDEGFKKVKKTTAIS